MTSVRLNPGGKELIHFTKFLFGLDKPNTQTTPQEQHGIEIYASGKKAAVEIGVFEGFNTLNIARSLDDYGILYAIDPFLKGRMGICYGELISRMYIKKAGLTDKVKFVKKFSFDASENVPGKLDFIFVDGDHSYNGIKKDWEIWSGKLDTGGIIALHDTSVPAHNIHVKDLGSYKYFNEVISLDPRFELLETIDSMNVLRKR